MYKVTLPDAIAEGIRDFRGRAWLPAQILDWWDHRPERVLLLTGGPGTGKSLVAAWLAGYDPAPAPAAPTSDLARLRELVKGAHFCNTIDSWFNSPKGLADDLARQLTANVPGFSNALLAQVGSTVTFNVNQEVAHNSGSVTGVIIEKLDLGKLLDEPAFATALLRPLTTWFASESRGPLLLVVDALDEAALYEGSYSILRAIAALTRLSGTVIRVIATVRDADALPGAFQGAYRRDLIQDAPPAQDDVADYVTARLKSTASPQLIELGPKILERARGNFLYASLVLTDLLHRSEQGQAVSVADVPDALADHYRQYLDRLTQDSTTTWRDQVRPVLGAVAVAQDPYLRFKALLQVSGQETTPLLDTLQRCRGIVRGPLKGPDFANSGPFVLFHKSFADFLLSPNDNLRYFVDAQQAHATLAQQYWPMNDPSPDYEGWDDYGLRNVPAHLAGAAQALEDEKRSLFTDRLVTLATLSDYQHKQIQRFGDLGLIELGLERALRTACQDTSTMALARIIRSAFSLREFRERTRQSRQVFRLAAQGDPGAARTRLSAFAADGYWRAAAEVLIAWVAADHNPLHVEAARALWVDVVGENPHEPTLDLLADRCATTWGEAAPPLPDLPPAPPFEILEACLYRLPSGNFQEEAISDFLQDIGSRLRETWLGRQRESALDPAEPPPEDVQIDGPVIVAYARDHPNESGGTRTFLRYLNVLAANQYRQYRNLSLWRLLDAALCHPDPVWAQRAAIRIVSAALTPGGAPFTESLSLILAGIGARSADADAQARLHGRLGQARRQAAHLSDARGRNDVSGSHKRRLAALALAYGLVPDGQRQVRELLAEAARLPRGYAGLMAPTWINLAETALIVASDQSTQNELLSNALWAACHVQDPAFRARRVLQVSSLIEEWWGSVSGHPRPKLDDLESTLRAFAAHPSAALFAPFYRTGADLPLPLIYALAGDYLGDLSSARTLREIAQALGYRHAAILDLNRGTDWTVDSKLPPGSEVRLPDSDYPLWLCGHFSAVIAATDMPARQKREWIQWLVPITLSDATVLDLVLARLAFVSRPEDPAVVRACENALTMTTAKPEGGPSGPVTGLQARSLTSGAVHVHETLGTVSGDVVGVSLESIDLESIGGGSIRVSMDDGNVIGHRLEELPYDDDDKPRGNEPHA